MPAMATQQPPKKAAESANRAAGQTYNASRPQENEKVGLKTKLQAAEICLNAGLQMAIALGEDPKVVHRIIDGEDVGTLFG